MRNNDEIVGLFFVVIIALTIFAFVNTAIVGDVSCWADDPSPCYVEPQGWYN